MNKILTNLFSFSKYTQSFNQAKTHPELYWKKEAQDLQWYVKPKTIIDQSNLPFVKWFPDGKINISHNCLDRHLPDRKDIVAFHVQSPITGTSHDVTIGELHERVSKLAGALQKDFGLRKGDTVVIYMPMIIESIVAKFACARLGLIHSVVFGGFAAPELAIRIKDCDAKLIICATAGKQPNKVIDYQEIVEEACRLSGKANIPKIIFERSIKPRTRFTPDYYDFLQVQKAGNSISPVPLQSTHPLYILYTSGTTGLPKGIVRDQGSTAIILNHALKYIYDLNPNDGLFCTSDIGWVLGHSFITYAPLLKAIRTILFEGKPVGTPDAGIFWRLIEKHKITHLYTSPTAMRGIRKEDPQGKFIKQRPLESLKGLTLVGQRCDIQTFKWVRQLFPNRFINDTYWQTQSGAPILTNYQGFQTYPFKPGSACKPVPGYDLKVMDKETGKQCGPNETGLICLKLPTPPSFMSTLWKRDELFKEKYFTTFPGYYDTGDSGYCDEDGYFYIMSRVDDIINTAGHRLSTGQMEEVLMKNQYIAQAIVVGGRDQIKGQVPIGFVTVKKGSNIDPKQLQKQVIKLIRHDIGAVASFKICHVVERIPKTRSGKYLRHIVKKIYNKEKYEVPSTIQNRQVVSEIEEFINGIVR